MKSVFKISFLLLIFVFINGCMAPCVDIQVKRPAQTDISKFKKISVGEIIDREGRVSHLTYQISDDLTERLMNTDGYFEVYDRVQIRRLLNERGFINKMQVLNAAISGRLNDAIGPTALIFGRVERSRYKEDIHDSKPYTVKKKGTFIDRTRRGTYLLTVRFKIVDSESGSIIAMKTFSTDMTEETKISVLQPEKGRNHPPRIRENYLYKQCVRKITNRFVRNISPHWEPCRVCFEKDEFLPRLETAVKYIKRDLWDQGLRILKEDAADDYDSHETKAKAFYNFGMALLYSGNYDEAICQFDNALHQMPGNDKYIDAIHEANFEAEQAERLRRQLDE